jgi:hypothetical protein
MTVNVFEIASKKIVTQAIRFAKDAILAHKTLPEIPLYSRSINILDKLYITGGEIDGQVLNTNIEIDLNTFEAILRKGMDIRRSGHTIVNISNLKLIVLSGSYLEKSCESYDISKNKWLGLPNVNESRVGASAFVYNGETIYLFFGKRWDSVLRRWVFIDTVERLSLYEKAMKWNYIYFKSNSATILRQRAFSGLISSSEGKVYLIGGQVIEDGRLSISSDCIEVNMENHIISSCDLKLPRPVSFLESNFYLINGNAIQFDNEGSILLYSSVYDELWSLDLI